MAGIPGARLCGNGRALDLIPGFEVLSGHWSDDLVAYNGAGVILPGWPRESSNYVATPPALADVDGDGLVDIHRRTGRRSAPLQGKRIDSARR